MKTIGLLGGMSWQSTQDYYRLINVGVNRQLGGLHSAKIILNSIDFQPIEQWQHTNQWLLTAKNLAVAAKAVEAAGADCLLICTNTMHKVADYIEQSINIPLLHIADATAKQLQLAGIHHVGLLGTAFTMEQDFYKGRLKQKYGLNVITPDKSERQIVHDIIYQELCRGIISDTSKTAYLQIIDQLAKQGATAVILGCTEIAMLVKASDTAMPLFDTTAIHAQSAVAFALEKPLEGFDKPSERVK